MSCDKDQVERVRTAHTHTLYYRLYAANVTAADPTAFSGYSFTPHLISVHEAMQTLQTHTAVAPKVVTSKSATEHAL